MDIQETFDAINSLVPVTRYNLDPSDYRAVLNTTLKSYMIVVELMSQDGLLDVDEVKEIGKTCDKLKDIITSEYQGLHSTAFYRLSNLLRGKNGLPALSDSIMMYTFKTDEKPLYRMREIEKRQDLSYKGLFHIPINKRGIVKTNRYSSPGYPCLYLGTSIYACWEELGRPPMNKSMVARLANGVDLHLIDLRIPTFDEFEEHYKAYMKAFPLIIACSVKVKEPDANYKPEYAIPQLMMEYVINNNVYRKTNIPIAGIYYTSVFRNDDYGFSIDKFENMAIPVQRPLSSKKYCNKLCEIFMMTRATCDEMEQNRSGGYIRWDYDEKNSTMRYHGNIGEYKYSSFGYLEKRLNDKKLFPLIPIDDK